MVLWNLEIYMILNICFQKIAVSARSVKIFNIPMHIFREKVTIYFYTILLKFQSTSPKSCKNMHDSALNQAWKFINLHVKTTLVNTIAILCHPPMGVPSACILVPPQYYLRLTHSLTHTHTHSLTLTHSHLLTHIRLDAEAKSYSKFHWLMENYCQ